MGQEPSQPGQKGHKCPQKCFYFNSCEMNVHLDPLSFLLCTVITRRFVETRGSRQDCPDDKSLMSPMLMQVSISRDDAAEERQNFGPLSPLSSLLGLLFLFVIRNLSFAFDIGGFIASIPLFAATSARYIKSVCDGDIIDSKLILLQIIRPLRHPIHTHGPGTRRSVRYVVR